MLVGSRLLQYSIFTRFCNQNAVITSFIYNKQFLHVSNNLHHEDEADELKSNPYFEKYSDQIQKAKASGVYRPRKEIQNRQLQKEANKWKKNIDLVEKRLLERKDKESDNRGSKLPATLSELVHMDLFKDKTKEEISSIWREYFKTREAISTVIPVKTFHTIMERSKDCPMFLYPLPKDQGYEFVLSQFDGNRCFFTSLINYQVHDDNAPWQLCLTFYPELQDKKDVVLLASEIDLSTMNILEAQCLAQLQQMFYATTDDNKFELVRKFNHDPDSLKYMDLVKEIESSDMVVMS